MQQIISAVGIIKGKIQELWSNLRDLPISPAQERNDYLGQLESDINDLLNTIERRAGGFTVTTLQTLLEERLDFEQQQIQRIAPTLQNQPIDEPRLRELIRIFDQQNVDLTIQQQEETRTYLSILLAAMNQSGI